MPYQPLVSTRKSSKWKWLAVSLCTLVVLALVASGTWLVLRPKPARSAAGFVEQLDGTVEEHEVEQVFKILEKHMASVPAGGGNVRSNLQQGGGSLTSKKEKLGNTSAFVCSFVDFSSFGSHRENKTVLDIMDKLELAKWCGLSPGAGETPHDPTCRAVWAGFAAHSELIRLGFDPVFKKMEVINWFQKVQGHYASWGTKNGVQVHYQDGMLQSLDISDKNAVSGFAFCDIVYTVLRQNFDQAQRGQCAPTAVLTALSHSNPAAGIKLGLQLYWTGTIPSIWNSDYRGCDYIYRDAPPGVVPFLPNQPGTEGSNDKPGSVSCTGNANDCANGQKTPNTNAGLQGMFAIKMASVRDQKLSGGCKPEDLKAWVQYPGMPTSRKASDGFTQPQEAAMMQAVFGKRIEAKRFLGTSAGDVRDQQALNEICSNKWGAVVSMGSSILKAAGKQKSGRSASSPFRLQESRLKCGMKKLTNTGNHMVYIDECPGDAVSIWSWTGRIFIARDALLNWGTTPEGPCENGQRGVGTRSALKFYFLVPSPEGRLG